MLVTRAEILEHAEAGSRVLAAAQRYDEKQMRWHGRLIRALRPYGDESTSARDETTLRLRDVCESWRCSEARGSAGWRAAARLVSAMRSGLVRRALSGTFLAGSSGRADLGKLAGVIHMFTLVTVPDHRFVALILPDPARRKLRLLFEYNGQLRAMCWMKIGSDGSFYLNPRTGNRGPLTHGVGIADGTGGFAELVWDRPDSPDEPNRKVSYHASGRVKGGARMSTALSLRDITESTLIRQDEYAHPSRFAIIEPDRMRSSDIVVPGLNGNPYQLDDEHPLTSRVFAAPLRAGNAQVPIIGDDPNARAGQTAIVIPAVNLKDCQDLTYQIQFFNRLGEWPEVTMIAILRPDGA